ncbi:unnamed protein product [Vitrella brassicaformis CCMP3155]|uniref:2Fe-2S ferredoxin-type domain-containing protein n=2 Tax=Vitrella brassicaformis TaxID=1169539 RepID=A0A0G4FJD2_VITBC|nr:unnamed protein product [Vitrella brassicaformis CCMP3155]|mmetsp:Transcript_29758/g.74031  ORF Transcript_29758/g.74031 Transcript_29758/m.74031 type:complete len:146 (+) Transcript_29758:117-554(+)|eukprot:CEM13725.1 unnamed protein product [Vitrella brassicaformis CCMP3155]
MDSSCLLPSVLKALLVSALWALLMVLPASGDSLLRRRNGAAFAATRPQWRGESTRPHRRMRARPLQMVTITFEPSKKAIEAKPGESLAEICAKNKIPVKYNCKKGQCATCESTLRNDKNGRTQKIRPCIYTVGSLPKAWTCIVNG